MKQILVTDSLFIFPEHEQQLRNAGYDVIRLNKPEATETELCEAIKGKAGYILGGVEMVTSKVIEAADELQAIVFTGIGYKHHIPGWQAATKKGIAIANAPDGPTQPVAEWAITAALAMNRGVFELASPDGKTFLTTQGLQDQTIGIIALGRIGSRIAEIVQLFRPAATLYHSTHRHEGKEQSLGLQYAKRDDLLAKSDVIFLCVPGEEVGDGYFNRGYISKMKNNALLVNINPAKLFDIDALYEALKSGRIRAVSDYPIDERFDKLPRSSWFSFKGSNAFNTEPSLSFTSSKATQALINLLTTGKDENLVNPEYTGLMQNS
jgi:D-3-phosphoglycerate dehydrogenase / 2-oxoglutarate reductase